VLDLSLSSALHAEQRVPAMALTIRTAQAASLNPALAVIVDGRSIFERPSVYRDVGADAACTTVIDLVAAVQSLLDDRKSRPNDPATRRPRGRGARRSNIPTSKPSAAAAASLRLFERRFKSTVF
jgi:hypothetical protein